MTQTRRAHLVVRSALLLAGLGPGLGLGLACQADSTSAAGDGVATQANPDEGTGEGPDCVTDADCAPHQQCWGGYCEAWCGAPAPTDGGELSNGPLRPRCSEDDSWDDVPGDGDDEPESCASAADCPSGYACLEAACVTPYAPLPSCVGPTLVEVPLPAHGEGPVVALAFVDFDADARDELVLLRDGALLVVDGETTHELAVPPLLNRLTVAQLDDDGVPDLLLGQYKAPATALVRGASDGAPPAFEAIELGELSLGEMVGVDWIAGGSEEIVVTSSILGAAPQIVAAIASGSPSVAPLDAAVPADRVVVADFGGDPSPELLLSHGCATQVLAGADIGLIFEDDLATSGCWFTSARIGPGANTDTLLALVPGNDIDLLVHLRFDAPHQTHRVTGDHTRAQSAPMPGLPDHAALLLGPEATWAWSTGDGTLDCQAPAHALSGQLQVVHGDVDGDGVAELASVDALGLVHLWAAG